MTPEILEGQSFADLEVGQSIVAHREIREADIRLFAAVSRDFNPVHLDNEYAKTTVFGETIAHGMLSASLLSALIAGSLPGPGTIYRGQELKFLRPVHAGDELEIEVKIVSMDERRKLVRLGCTIRNQKGKTVVSGEAEVIPPEKRTSVRVAEAPRVTIDGTEY